MLDPASIVAIVTVILSYTKPLFTALWRKIKSFYGAACKSTSYLRNMDQGRLRGDLQNMLTSDGALRASAQRYYIDNQPTQDAGYSSDFSDFSDL
ncbi:hypothetical protein BX600DRAFT_518271 [Xylariales sp. PMI_506]|nr:hypothetical protein BX600DRAFT_518271 [Xylariales sp. PMI_506]